MKKLPIAALFILISGVIFAQQPPKYALVIGNGDYTGLTPLKNPVNDADDMAAVLQELGFAVEKVVNGNLAQMEEAVSRLRDSLKTEKDAYGFFFYAGHGVQSNGDNYLIPVNANIPSENYLRERALSVQIILDDLNDARNSLNVVVLDACRDNPFGWGRGSGRGRVRGKRQPADTGDIQPVFRHGVSGGTGRGGGAAAPAGANTSAAGRAEKRIRPFPPVDSGRVGRQFICRPVGDNNGTRYNRPVQAFVSGAGRGRGAGKRGSRYRVLFPVPLCPLCLFLAF
jgi:hypothetical protein